MTIVDSDRPLEDKLLHVAALSGKEEFTGEFRRLKDLHGSRAVYATADELERELLIEWPIRDAPATLIVTGDGLERLTSRGVIPPRL